MLPDSKIHPWTIYAEQLFSLGHGYPLWYPEPDKSRGEIFIGDVGWMSAMGKFRQLLATVKRESGVKMRGATGDSGRTLSGSDAFEELDVGEICEGTSVMQPTLYSESIRLLSAEGAVAAEM